VAFSPDNAILALSEPKTITLWNTDTGEQIRVFDGLSGAKQFMFDKHGHQLIIYSWRKGPQIVTKDVTTGSDIQTIPLPELPVTDLKTMQMQQQLSSGKVTIVSKA